MSYMQEQAVISHLLVNNNGIDQCEGLTVDCFIDDQLRTIYAEILRQAGKPFDVVSIGEKLQESVSFMELHEIATAHTRISLPRHVSALIDGKKNRQLQSVAELVNELSESEKPMGERIDIIGTELSKLVSDEAGDDWVDSETSVMEHMDVLDDRHEGRITGLTTGLSDFDGLLDGGFQRGNLVVIGARPSMGKTALGLTMAVHMAEQYSVGFLSMEMPHADVRDRLVALLGRVSISALKRPKSHELEWDRVLDAVERAKRLKFHCSDKGGLNILQVRAKARQLKRRKGLDVLIVDYIGLMSGLDPKVSRAYQIEEISRGLKTLAKELDIVVICLAQVNRGAADRGNQCPALHDLRDSGAIEQDADVVGFVHRPIMAEPTLPKAIWGNYALLRIAKNRQGRCDDVHMFYQGEETRFGGWGGNVPVKTVRGGGSEL